VASKGKISNIKRLRQIINAFVRHGLGHMVKLAGLDTYISVGKRLLLRKGGKEEEVSYTNPQRMVLVFEELGPTFIKLGQILSTRKDQLPREYIVEFEKLQDSTAPVPFEKMNLVFEAEFGKSALEVFDYIDKNPMASASIGQVHAARLKTGEEVVVKIRNPGIEHVIDADLKILHFLANQIEKVVPKDAMFSPLGIVKEFEAVIKNELDFAMEGKNIERFQHNFKNHPEVHFPSVYWECSSLRVLVMERIEGIPIGDIERLREKGHDLRKIADNLFQLTLKQLFIDAFFHADPHPGNFIIMENGVIGIIDCGMVGFMEESFVNAFIDCFVGIFLKDYDLVVRGYMAVGTITEDIDIPAFKNDIRNFTEHYMNISLNTVSISTILDDIIKVAVRNRMKIPSTMLFISKALVTAEGTIKKLDPGFDYMGHSINFAKTLIVKKKFDPNKLLADGFDFISGMSTLAQNLPKQTSKILSMIEERKISVNVSLSGSKQFYRRLDSDASRISLALISAGLGVASSLVIQSGIRPLFFGISMLGLFGYVMAVVLGIWVVYLVVKKGE